VLQGAALDEVEGGGAVEHGRGLLRFVVGGEVARAGERTARRSKFAENAACYVHAHLAGRPHGALRES
jgi:hypothetical protein